MTRAPAPELIGESMHGRALYLSTISDLGEWPATFAQPKPYFVLLLVLDASRLTDEQVRAFADKVATQGGPSRS